MRKPVAMCSRGGTIQRKRRGPTLELILLALLFLSVGHARSAEVERVDTSQLSTTLIEEFGMRPVSWENVTLNREGRRLSRESLRDDSGVGAPHVGFTWANGDQQTKLWYPQGITGLERGAERKLVIVSWYGKDANSTKGVRLSFVDVTQMSRIRYRHVLLVEPALDVLKVFQPVPIHAGGLATRDNIILVADTNHGLRAFDTRNLFEAMPDPDKNTCGIKGGKAYAFDYRYILPQVARYEMDGPNFSFASLDWTDRNSPKLLTGNYHNPPNYDNPPPALVWWGLEGTRITRKLRDTRDEGLKLQNRTQGAVYHDGIVYLSCSGNPAHFYVSRDPFREFKRYPWPYGAEDLHYSPNSMNLWCLTEHPGKRIVWAVKLEAYPP